jgi:hypothetical protein
MTTARRRGLACTRAIGPRRRSSHVDLEPVARHDVTPELGVVDAAQAHRGAFSSAGVAEQHERRGLRERLEHQHTGISGAPGSGLK